MPPAGYDELIWAPHPESSTVDLEHVLRARMRASPKSRPAIAARTIGWLYSGGRPDSSV